MGTPEFAVPSLQALARADDNIILVVTQPDRPKGRGRKLAAPPVKTEALELGLPVEQPKSIKEEAVVEALAARKPDLFVVVAYGGILSKRLLEVPPLGTINVHPSPLPQFRGAAPIQRAILNGLEVTGVTTMLMNEKLDSGDILLQETVPILPEDTGGSLHDKLAVIGADLLAKTVAGVKDGSITPRPQDESRATYAAMLKKEEGLVDWTRNAQAVCDQVRAFDPWPGAYTTLNGKRLALFNCAADQTISSRTPGEFLEARSGGMAVAAGKGAVIVREVQLQGRARMDAVSFLRGAQLKPGAVLPS